MPQPNSIGHRGILKYRREKDTAHIHKEKYWVADLAKGTLECYSNDNDALPKFTLYATHIQSVHEDVDRQNKFFDFRVKTTTKGGELCFRSQSQQDRDAWIHAIQALIAGVRTMQQAKQFIQAIDTRCDDATARLDLGAWGGTVRYEGIISLQEVPSALRQHYISATDDAIKVAERVLTDPRIAPYQHQQRSGASGTSGNKRNHNVSNFSPLVRDVRIFIVNGYQPNAPPTMHDSETGGLSIVITLLANNGKVANRHEDADVIVAMAQRALDERSKGFSPEPSAAEAFAALNAYLRPTDDDDEHPAADDVFLKYRYADAVAMDLTKVTSSSGAGGFARRYLARHVTGKFLTGILDTIKQACEESTKGSSARKTENTAPFGGSQSSPLVSTEGTEGASTSPTYPLPPAEDDLANPLSPGAALLEQLTPLGILQDMLAGFVVEIPMAAPTGHIAPQSEEALLSQPPRLHAVRKHDEEGDIEMTFVRTEVALRRFRASERGVLRNAPHPALGEQLLAIVVQVQVASQCSLVEERINMLTRFKKSCIIDWGGFLGAVSDGASSRGASADGTAASSSPSPIPACQLPAIINAFGEVYTARMAAALDRLRREPLPMPHASSHLTPPPTLFEAGYGRCVAGNTIAVRPRASTTINRGLLSEAVSISVKPHQQGGASSFVHSSAGQPDMLLWSGDEASGGGGGDVFIHFFSDLGEWLTRHFNEPDALADVAPQFDQNGMVVDEQELQLHEGLRLKEKETEAYLTQQEKVAIARSTENSALRMMDISRIVQDQQQNFPLGGGVEATNEHLLASESTIHAGVMAMDACFMPTGGHRGPRFPMLNNGWNGKLIDKQDIVKVLTIALIRLRILFKHALDLVAQQRALGQTPSTANAGDDEASHAAHGSVATDHIANTLSAMEATTVLTNYCNYKESEGPILNNGLLHSHRQRTNDLAEHPRFAFDDVAYVALTQLLPEETRLSSLSRRDVLVIGLDGSSKSTVINHIRHQSGRDTLATIGIAETFVAHHEWVLAFKELGGRVDFRKNWREYFKALGRSSIHGIMVVVDVQDTKRYGEVRSFVREVVTDKLCTSVPVLFVLNNYDESGVDVGAVGQRSGSAGGRTNQNANGRQGNGREQRRGDQSPAAVGGRGAKKYSAEQIAKKLELNDLAKGHGFERVYCNVTKLSSDKAIDQRLADGLKWFCMELLNKTPMDKRPRAPKPDGVDGE